jgi:hypothetical protein
VTCLNEEMWTELVDRLDAGQGAIQLKIGQQRLQHLFYPLLPIDSQTPCPWPSNPDEISS